MLDNAPSLISIIRECNFTLRWLLLHRLVYLYLVLNIYVYIYYILSLNIIILK
jgi:hypothetical protein